MNSNRRNFIKKIGTGTTALTIGSTAMAFNPPSAAEAGKEDDDQILFIGDNIALAETQYGKVKGYLKKGVYCFLGIPYGDDTSGANRFMPPQKPKPWTGVFQAVWWGNSAPQSTEKKYTNRLAAFIDRWNYDDVSEDCLRLNVFTKGISDNKKRPVIVWLHGGGYAFGNAIEQDGYGGENIARFGDVVYVSVNHRLNAFGFSDLSAVGGKKYAASGNVGMLDLVAALEWVRDNIANFGGNPGNVTIIGQSGGGGKVTNLTAMPSARGLIHKAVVLSGAMLKSGDKAISGKLGEYILKEAGLTVGQTDQLQTIPWPEYLDIANRANTKLMKDLDPSVEGMFRSFGPVVDGVYLPQHPYSPEATPNAAEIPMLICSTLNESSPSRTDSSLENITLPQVKEKLGQRTGPNSWSKEKISEVVDAYAKAFPDKKPVEIWSMIMSSRKGVVSLAEVKSRQKPPVFVAWFCWQPPLFDNHMRAFHCSDICFWFYNTDVMLTHTGGGSRPRKLSVKMSKSLVQFMKTGNPNGGGLPEWPRFTTEKGETMLLNDQSEVKNDPDREARRTLPA
jgi:para-nitrobenzyl esterase